MGLHKLTAGDGYTYLTRQVAAHDVTERGYTGLGDYYTERGESPGRWWGAGLAAFDATVGVGVEAGVEIGVEVGSEVTEQQMRNLFGEGRHPHAERLEEAALDAGQSVAAAKKASQLGRLFAVYTGNAPVFLQESARRFTANNYEHGRHWRSPVPAEIRARIRTELAEEMFTRQHGRPPLDDRERASFLAQATRQQTTAVAGYDLTFTAVKSVSTLWALADRDVAGQVEDAHHAAVAKTLAWLEAEVLFTRRGRRGVQQVKAAGLIAATFTHRDARSGDPHLHTHVAISNKVQDTTDGRWLAVDGRVLYKANVTLSERYNTLLEAELIARLGVRFAPRPTGVKPDHQLRPIREIDGLDQRLATAWSRRHTAIESRRRELAAAFQASHHRPPTPGESVALAKQAWSETRQAKHAPRSEADQRRTWRAEAINVLGSERAVQTMVNQVLGHRLDPPRISDTWVAETAEQVTVAVQHDRATWQVWHLRSEAERCARAAGVLLGDHDMTIDRVVAAAIAEYCVAFPHTDPLTDPLTGPLTGPDAVERAGVAVPASLTRPDGTSVYSLHGACLFTSRTVLEAERRIIDAARRDGGRRLSHARVGIAITQTAAPTAAQTIADRPEHATVAGVTLNAGQQALVRELATSGRRVQLALAPAGTGKTTAMGVLSRAWQDSGGTILGLAPSAVAATELRSALNPGPSNHQHVGPNVPAAAEPARGLRPHARPDTRDDTRSETLAKLVWHVRHGDAPAWMRAINQQTLVLIDEAGMAATTDLADAIGYITRRGGSVRLIGDDRQLASVAAGGVLRDITHQVGAVTLTEVRRFLHPDGNLNIAEAAATLAVRDGDLAVIGFYADRSRIHVGDLGSCADQAYAAWSADRVAGIDSLLLAPTRELVAELNTRARHDRLSQPTTDQLPGNSAGKTPGDVGRVHTLGDGTQVSAGDTIITRQNNRLLALSPTDWVKNGDRWTVTRAHRDGTLTVTHQRHPTKIRLPADYVAAHVQLGYATTVHGAQGATVGTCHVVLTGGEDRNLLYVALSRGQYANHLYLAVGSDGDPHNLIRPEALIPPTALDQLADILARDGSPVSATTALRDHTNPTQLLHDAAARYHDALSTGAEQLLGPAGLDRIDQHAQTLIDGLTDAPAWATLRSHLALLALDDHNPLTLLTAAVHTGTLTDAHDPAAVLDARIDDHLIAATTGTRTSYDWPPDQRGVGIHAAPGPLGPLPWLPGIPARLAGDLDWGPYLAARHRQVLDHAAAVTDLTSDWTPDTAGTAPSWAQPFLEDPDKDLRAHLAVWRAVHHTPDTDRRPTGEPTIGTPGHHQAMLNRAVRKARPSYPFAQRHWYQALPETVRTDPWITPLCQRLARLERAGLPVADYITQALTPNPAITPATDPAIRPDNDPKGPLPDQHQAAALWWRLVPHLGPAALDADQHSSDLLTPTWSSVLTHLVGGPRADYLRHSPAWPALVAAVDASCQHHGWNPNGILTAALAGIPTDGIVTGTEIADALVLRIAMLTDPPPDDPDDDPDVDRDFDTGNEHAYPSHAEGRFADPHGDEDVATDLEAGQLHTCHTPVDKARDQPGDPAEELADELAGDAIVNPFIDSQLGVQHRVTASETSAQDSVGVNVGVSAEYADPDPDRVSAERIVACNQQALAYYQSRYQLSWAPGYLRERLGTDLADYPTLVVGYAPPGPRSLLTHLTELGATLHELEQAGLIRPRVRRDRTTEFVDVFRDRLIMPIRDAQHPNDTHHLNDTSGTGGPGGMGVVGFLGRRNPTKGDHDFAGPKYLNTRNTAVFSKGHALFGYPEMRAALLAGALPVLVEGPLDAYAMTLGSGGTAVGLSPMGTALTADQISILRRHISLTNGRDRIAVATDADPAGWKAAQTAFWKLAAADLDPTYLALPDRHDPASLLQAHGPAGIQSAIDHAVPLADAMLDQLLHTTESWSEPTSRQHIVEHAARILAARGPDTWRASLTRLNRRLHLSTGLLEHHTLTESIERDRQPDQYTRARIADLQERARANRMRHLTAPTVSDAMAEAPLAPPQPYRPPKATDLSSPSR